MSGFTEQFGYEPAPAVIDPVHQPTSNGELIMAELSLKGTIIGGDQPVKTWRTAQAAGDEAYHLARQHENEHGLDEEAAYMYEEATRELIGVTWRGPEAMLEDPINELRIAYSLAKQAQAIEEGVLPGHSVDEEAVLQATASKTLRHGLLKLMDQGSREVEVDGELSDINPTEIVAEAAVEAAIEVGTDEHVAIRGINKLDEETPHQLEAKGEEVVVSFVREHSKEPRHGSEFIASTAGHVEEEITGIHEVHLAA